MSIDLSGICSPSLCATSHIRYDVTLSVAIAMSGNTSGVVKGDWIAGLNRLSVSMTLDLGKLIAPG
jgi:hypothetical protein